MDDSASDEDLMLRYRGGDVRAFETLYRRHNGPLYRYFLRMVRPPAVAEELFQDVWTSIVRARAEYEVRAKFATWLYRVAHNRLIDHYRRVGAGMPLSYGDDPDDALETIPDAEFREPANELERRRLAQRIVELVAELPEAQREIFLLREEGGLSLEEIAAATGVPAETAKSRLRYALAKLRRALADQMEPAPLRAKEQRS
ncbi:MAG: RNA polymerase sigma factor [Sulfurifustaceae bacterium]